MPRRRIHPGDSLNKAISAADWNAMLDLLNHRDKAGLWSPAEAGQSPRTTRVPRSSVVWLYNATGAHLPQFAIVGIDRPAVDASATYGNFQREVTVSATTPTNDHRGKFAVTCDAIPTGRCGWACVDGVVQARVDIGDASHEWCEVEAGNSSTLLSGDGGSARIVWRRAQSGAATWCYVRIGDSAVDTGPFYIRNNHTNLTSGRGLELGSIYSGQVVNADLRADCDRAYCILAEDINVNTIGRAKASGWATARVDIVDTAHTHVFLREGEVVFESGFGGPLELLQTPASTGEGDYLVRFQPLYRRRILTNAAILSNNYADCNFYGGATLNTVLGTDDVYFNWMKAGVAEVPSGVEGWATWDEGISAWIIDSAECGT